MSTKFMKRPSSAKRHIKYENFSLFVSASRLRNVQALLCGDENIGTKPSGVDAILCVSGIDSRYNEGCYELINYLLFGFFDVRKAELERSGFPEEVIDDLILVIRKTRVDVYCNPINWHYFLPYISHWTNVSFHCLQEEEYDLETDNGAEMAEEFKVRSLIAMTRGCHCIGIPFYSSSTGQSESKFDKMLVEKWPVIQAFALEDFGSGGFFTLKYEVSDISALVHQLHSVQDPVTIEIITTEKLPMLERQWKTMSDCVTMEIAKNRGVLTQERISEPLCSFFQHGRVGNHRKSSGNCKLPFVLFGKNTSKASIASVQSGSAAPSYDIQLSASNSVGHMVCQVMSPRSPLTCARTYFVSHFFNSQPEVTEVSPERTDSGSSCVDGKASDRMELSYLVTLYQGMVDAVMAGIGLYAQTGSLTKARANVLEVLKEKCQSITNSSLTAFFSDRSKLVFSVESVQKNGSVKEVVDDQRSQLMKVAMLCLYDIPAVNSSCTSPGSLVFSECFLDSAITITSGTQTSIDSDILYLTSHIPRFLLWGASADIRRDQRELKQQLESTFVNKIGTLLMTGDKVEITAGSELTLPPESVQLYVYQNGITVYSENYGCFTLTAADCSHVHLFDGDSMTTAVLLIITYHTWSAVKLPPHLLTPENMLFIVIAPRSKAHTHLYGQVLTSWKQDSEMPTVSRIEADELPEQLDALHHYLQQVHHNDMHSLVTAPQTTSLKDAAHNLPHLPQFLKHLSVSSAVPNAVSRSDLPHLLQKDPDFEVTSDNEQVLVTVLTGAPGSEKQSLCKSLSKLGTEYIKWVVVRQMEETVLDAGQIHKMLSSAVTSHLQQQENKRQTRVLLVAPGFINTPDVVNTVLRHPEAKVRNMLKIGAVTTCIDPLNAFVQNRMLLPMLLNQCAQGWVNNIIFTSQTKAPSAILDQIQGLIRCVNSDVALLLAESGEIKRSTDLDQVLSDTAFEQPAMVRARILLHPAWKLPMKNGPLKSSLNMTDIILKFSRPLERFKLMQRLKGIPGSLSKFPFEGNIYHIYGLVCFSDSSSTVDLQYSSLSQSLVMLTVGTQSQPVIRGQHQYYMVFTGCNLSESALKDWLRACAKQKPEKKKNLAISDISKAELSKIHKEHHLDPLPSGWFYNGTQFVSMDGDKADQHPSMKEFISDYLKAKNEEIDKYNAAISKEKYPDLFS